MSKRTIEVDIYQCDYVDERGNRCDKEGERQAIRACALCGMDLCSKHYEMVQVGGMGSRANLMYHFCEDHMDEFLDTLIKTFGDTRSVGYAGMAK